MIMLLVRMIYMDCIYIFWNTIYIYILKEGSMALYHCQNTGQTEEIKWWQNSLVPTETLPVPSTEPFCAGNTLVRSRRIHTLLTRTSTWSQTFINIWKIKKAGHGHFMRIPKQTLTFVTKGEMRVLCSGKNSNCPVTDWIHKHAVIMHSQVHLNGNVYMCSKEDLELNSAVAGPELHSGSRQLLWGHRLGIRLFKSCAPCPKKKKIRVGWKGGGTQGRKIVGFQLFE